MNAGAVGAFIVFAVLFVPSTVWFGKRLRRRPDSWLWRHGVQHSEEFVVDRTPTDVVARVVSIAHRERGWRISQADPEAGTVTLTTATTPFSWTKRMTVAAQTSGVGPSHVQISVTVPQLLDWGEGRRLGARVRQEIASGAPNRRGPVT